MAARTCITGDRGRAGKRYDPDGLVRERITLTKTDFRALALSVGEHVEACHDRWEALADELQAAGAAGPAALEAVDITAGWPPVAPAVEDMRLEED